MIKKAIFFVFLSAGMFLCLTYRQIFWLGWIIVPVFFWLAAGGFEKALVKFFCFLPSFRVKCISIFFAIIVFGYLSGAVLIFYRLNAVVFSVIMVLVGAVSFFLGHWAQQAKNIEVAPESEQETIEIPQSNIYLYAFFIFIIFGLIVLWRSRTGEAILSPWQIIPQNYFYLFFLSVLTLGGLLFSKFKSKTLLVLLIIQMFYLAAYLPFSHKLFYGADGWRHIAAMEEISFGRPLAIKNYAENPTLVERINPGTLSYSQFWSAMVFFSRSLNIDLVTLISWFQPVLASIFIPLLVYEIGLALGLGRKKPVLLVWLMFWPFAIHAAISFTLPVSLGFLAFLLFILMLVKRGAHARRKEQIIILAVLSALSFFGYALYTIVFIGCWALYEILVRSDFSANIFAKRFVTVLLFVFSIAYIPLIEFFAGYAKIDSANIFSAMKQFVGNFSGYFLANGPRPHIIDTGNVFFNQIPSYAFISNALTAWRYWIPVVMIVVFGLVVYGAMQLWRRGPVIYKTIVVVLAGLYGGYFISRYLFEGQNILSRRLDAVLAFFTIVALFFAVEKFFERNRFASMLVILIGASVISASFSLGPMSRAMGENEYGAAKIVWSETGHDEMRCVVADTYQLLALEAVSAKKVIGGGFPINSDFSQPELTSLYSRFSASSTDDLWQRAHELTGAEKCYLIINGKITSKIFN